MKNMEEAKVEQKKATWEPRIVAFLCNWCSYAGADLAGVSRIQDPPNIRIIRVMGSRRVDPVQDIAQVRSGGQSPVGETPRVRDRLQAIRDTLDNPRVRNVLGKFLHLTEKENVY